MAASSRRLHLSLSFTASEVRISASKSDWKFFNSDPAEYILGYISTGVKMEKSFPGFTTISYSEISKLIDAITASTSLASLTLHFYASLPKELAKQHEIVMVLQAFHGKSQLTSVNVGGYFSGEFFGDISAMLVTLPLENLELFDIMVGIDRLEPLHSIKSLKRLLFESPRVPIEDRTFFLIPFMDQLEILDMRNHVTQAGLDAIASNLAKNTTLRKLAIHSEQQSLSGIGNALKTNTRLQHLSIGGWNSDLTPIFDGMVENKAILKLAIGVDLARHVHDIPDDDQTYVPALVRMLRYNRYLENLYLNIDFIPEDLSVLIQPIVYSSLIELSLIYDNSDDISYFIEELLPSLRSNTTLTSLTISTGPDEENEIDASILVDLLTRNSTLEVLDLSMVRVKDPEQLSALIYNQSLIQVSSNMPKILKDIAKRNKANRDVRNMSLFKLVS